jgi:hypothetical protein
VASNHRASGPSHRIVVVTAPWTVRCDDRFPRRGGYRNVLHDFDLRIERQIAEGDMVETHRSLRGTHGGELEGTRPPARFPQMNPCTSERNRAVERPDQLSRGQASRCGAGTPPTGLKMLAADPSERHAAFMAPTPTSRPSHGRR